MIALIEVFWPALSLELPLNQNLNGSSASVLRG